MNSLRRFATKEPTVCAVCRRRAWSIGSAPRQNAPILWLCDDADCISVGKTVYNMAQKDVNLFELTSMKGAGKDGGAYLDELGVFDLTQLSPDQYDELP
jgi:hypothetical protein